MALELTEQQMRALDDSPEAPTRVTDPRTNTEYVLVPASDYIAVQQALEDERRQTAIRRVGLRNAAGRMEQDP